MRTEIKSGTILGKDFYDITTNIVFAINQLSPSSINISPLTIILLRILQHSKVRSINNLMMAGSLGFGSINCNFFLFIRHIIPCYKLITH